MKKKSILLFILSLITAQAYALEHSSKLWSGIDFDGPIGSVKHLHYNILTQFRFDAPDLRREQIVLRPSLYYEANNGITAWLGFDAIPTWQHGKDQSILERRLWPQVEFAHPLTDSVEIDFRSRYEVRWRKDSSQVANRFRQRVMLSKNFSSRDLKLKASDELLVFVKKADWVSQETIDQNRFYLGFSMPINHHCSIDVGYLNIFRSRRTENTMQHVFMVGLGVGFGETPQPYLTGVG